MLAYVKLAAAEDSAAAAVILPRPTYSAAAASHPGPVFEPLAVLNGVSSV